MECLVQYLDDIEDGVYAIALAAERIRSALKTAAALVLKVSLLALAVTLAWQQPPLALAFASLLAVTLLYRAVINHPGRFLIRR